MRPYPSPVIVVPVPKLLMTDWLTERLPDKQTMYVDGIPSVKMDKICSSHSISENDIIIAIIPSQDHMPSKAL